MRRITLSSFLAIAEVVGDVAPKLITAWRAGKVAITRTESPEDPPMTEAELQPHFDAFKAKQEQVGGDIAGRIEGRHQD